MGEVRFLDLLKINSLHQNEIEAAMLRVVRSGRFLFGDEVPRFEEALSEYVGTRHAVGFGNGLDALTAIFKAYIQLGKLKPGDEVLVPSNTFLASLLAITDNHLSPVFVEPSLVDFQIDTARLTGLLSGRTRALLLVHLYGRCAYNEEIELFCRENDLLLIEDNAQAIGAQCSDGRKTGSLGHAAAFSFFPAKNLGALGDAGAVTTADDELAERLRAIGNYGFKRKHHASCQGKNSRMDELQASVLSAKLPYIDEENELRRAIAREYLLRIENPAIKTPDISYCDNNVFHIFPVLSEKRDELKEYMRSRGIETQIHYPVPPHRQECYRDFNAYRLPVTEYISRSELSLPISPVLTPVEISGVIEALNGFR